MDANSSSTSALGPRRRSCRRHGEGQSHLAVLGCFSLVSRIAPSIPSAKRARTKLSDSESN